MSVVYVALPSYETYLLYISAEAAAAVRWVFSMSFCINARVDSHVSAPAAKARQWRRAGMWLKNSCVGSNCYCLLKFISHKSF